MMILQPNVRTRAVSDAATPFGCCNFFDTCNDGIFSLYYRGTLDLLDWMGFDVTDECHIDIAFIDYLRPEQEEGSDTAGYISDACANPNGIEFGSCSITYDDFGLYGRTSPARNIFKPMKYCKQSPRWMLDGSPVENEGMWDMLLTMDWLLSDIRRALISDSALSGAGHFDGLQRWVRNSYTCNALNSYVVDWNSNPMAGGAGITINGAAVAATFSLVDVLLDLYRNVRERMGWSPLFTQQMSNMLPGDIILVLPGFLGRCLLDQYTCWSVCPEAQYAGTPKPTLEMREFRNSLNGGMFGNGKIFLDGFEIPLLFYDWDMISGPTTGDIYMLTGRVGAQRIWRGQHISAENAIQTLDDSGLSVNAGDFFSRDGGRVLGKGEFTNLCIERKLWMAPRILCYAPWAQIRFQDVVCRTPSGPLSPDPADTSFHPTGGSFTPAVCP